MPLLQSSPAASRRERSILLACLVVALLARVVATLVVEHPELLEGRYELVNDNVHFHRPAEQLALHGRYSMAEDAGPTAVRPPGAILPLAGIYSLLGPDPRWSLAWVMATSVVLVWLIGVLTRDLTNDFPTAVWAMAITATTPTLVTTSGDLRSDPQAMMLLIATILALLRAGRSSAARAWAVAGILLAATVLTRPGTLPVIAIAAAWWWLAGTRRRPRQLAALLVVFALPLGLWGWRNHQAFGQWLLGDTTSGHTLWESNNPLTAGMQEPALDEIDGFDLQAEADAGHYLGSWVPWPYIGPDVDAEIEGEVNEVTRHEAFVARTRRFLLETPEAWPRLALFKLQRFFSARPVAPSLNYDLGFRRVLKRTVLWIERWFYLIFAPVGLWLLWRRGRRREVLLLAGVAGMGIVVVFVAYPSSRHLLGTTVPLIPAAAVAVRQAQLRLLGTRRPTLS